MTETKFNLQAALEALLECIPSTPEHADILRDLRERLAGAQEGWQRADVRDRVRFTDPHAKFSGAPPGIWHPVLIINVDSEE